ncbi:hypothetical protein AOC05_05960 [Arthrobacter alpinus]|uniref:Uncharacterized protein n=2 Tax=Arthrobacter TaxID=1663 RepID=A0A0M5LX74_9MICC|nr:hypothetical protein AOC05_05960 [Arthrobacter alpinus]
MMKVEDTSSVTKTEKTMTTRIRGKQLALKITTAVTVGSFAVVGIGAIAIDQATPRHTATTNSVADDDGGTSQNQAPSQGNGSYSGYSGGNAVQSGGGGVTSGRSSGS